MTEMILKGRLDGKQRNKLKSLFNMMYTPRELADAIGIHIDQIYAVYVPLGCPQERDDRNHILINGKDFSRWYSEVYPKTKLGQDETFCKTCKKGVKIFQPETKRKGNLIYVLSVCPICGRNLTRIIQNGRSNDK
ncbi:MAG: hypothetical protein U0Z26_17850 [Anaerolineales bacterium]